jgi:hypothetical protein
MDNKYQKALNKIEKLISYLTNEPTKEIELPELKEANGSTKILKELVDKATPTKVTHEASLKKCCTCPKCKNVVDRFEVFGDKRIRVTYDYCQICGQALDWSETHD